jgi:hypothetical protein
LDRIRKLFKSLSLHLPETTLTAEEKEDLIDQLAQKAVDLGMDTPTLMALSIVKPTAQYINQLTLIYWAPVIEMLGFPAYQLGALFHESGNLERLIHRIEELKQ